MHDIKSRYRADQVPWYWWLPMQLYGWVVGGCFYLYSALVAVTSRVQISGADLDENQNYIFCFWHRSMFIFMCHTVHFHKLSFITHPLWYMAPAHASSKLKGARRQIFGSSGYRGRESAQELVELVRKGDNTFFNPDGPYGPAGKVHKGALHVAVGSGVPLVAVNFISSRHITLNGWDRKEIPLPFGRIEITYHEPFLPTADQLDESADRLAMEMGPVHSEARS